MKAGVVLGCMLAGVAAFGLSPSAAAQDQPSATAGPVTELPKLTVIGTTPMPGSGIDIDKVPSNVQTMSAQDLNRDGESSLLPTAAALRMSSVSLNDEQGSQYQPDFVYRGFEASPVSGIAEGLAVYQNGTRINEAFGDAVNWDLVPQFAVNRLTVQSDNPVFGLNALGGAVTLDMKNGFNSHGGNVQLSGGSYGNLTGYGEYAARHGNFGVYGAIGGLEDDGFRYHSPTALHQGYTDIGYEDQRAILHLSLSVADNSIGATGPTPVQLLRQDPKAVFTYPQAMHNESGLVQLTGSYQLTATQLFSADAYFRRFQQRLIDGNTTNVQACGNNGDFFCLEGSGNYPGDALHDASGNQVPTSVLPAGATPGEIDRTGTSSNSAGAAMQWTLLAPVLGRDNHLVLGVSFDHGSTGYQANGELGILQPGLEVNGVGVIIDQGNSGTAQPPLEEPVSIRASNDYYGAYFTDTFNITPALAWSLSARYNQARISLNDLIGSSLDGAHQYNRFNPGTGLSYKISDAVTGYAGYAEANRAPTAGELSCANPDSPCLLGAFLVSDPDLKQVVARTYEAGLRGHFTAGLPGRFSWNFSLYRTDSRDDIILLATDVNGFGYYSNAGTTRRQGLETSLAYHSAKWDLNANYSLVEATFRESLSLASSSPAADANGNIEVRPGDRIPLTPRQRITLQAEYSVTGRWKLGSDLRYTSGQYLAGDESNQQPKLPAYTVVDLHSSYQLSRRFRVFAVVDNLFDRTYYTYGSFTQLDGLPPNVSLTDPRAYSPSPGRTVFGGVHLGF